MKSIQALKEWYHYSHQDLFPAVIGYPVMNHSQRQTTKSKAFKVEERLRDPSLQNRKK